MTNLEINHVIIFIIPKYCHNPNLFFVVNSKEILEF